MRTKTSPAVTILVVLGLLFGSLVGCGGGGEQSGNGGAQGGDEQQGEQQGGGGQQAGEDEDQGRSPEKVALGTIESVEPESRKVVLKPSYEAQGGDQITFKVRKNAEVQVNDQDAELSDIQPGQSAKIGYVTKNDVNRAVSVEIVGGG
ncbi:MAG TPA: hypothetical protein VFR69_01850 [Rubrobacteraceae bacterium]|nr:hypothetical protein [Rubrobacteraceae bacterium]